MSLQECGLQNKAEKSTGHGRPAEPQQAAATRCGAGTTALDPGCGARPTYVPTPLPAPAPAHSRDRVPHPSGATRRPAGSSAGGYSGGGGAWAGRHRAFSPATKPRGLSLGSSIKG